MTDLIDAGTRVHLVPLSTVTQRKWGMTCSANSVSVSVSG